MPFTESSVTLNFPDGNYFRFCDCDGYRELQNNFAEMDACWYDQPNDTLYLIELKDWGDGTLNEETNSAYSADDIQKKKDGISDYRIKNLVKKSIDSATMVISVLLGRPAGIKIQQCSPFAITMNTKIILISVINWTNADISYVINVNTVYRSKFKSYAKFFGIHTYLVLTKTKAMQLFAWIS